MLRDPRKEASYQSEAMDLELLKLGWGIASDGRCRSAGVNDHKERLEKVCVYQYLVCLSVRLFSAYVQNPSKKELLELNILILDGK